jgi:hypothetical protein
VTSKERQAVVALHDAVQPLVVTFIRIPAVQRSAYGNELLRAWEAVDTILGEVLS